MPRPKGKGPPKKYHERKMFIYVDPDIRARIVRTAKRDPRFLGNRSELCRYLIQLGFAAYDKEIRDADAQEPHAA